MRGLADGQKLSFDLEKDRQGRESAANLKAV
jgi:cold shock CspA family protein